MSETTDTIELQDVEGKPVTVPLWPSVATIGKRVEGQAMQSCGDGTRVVLFRQKEEPDDAKHVEVKPAEEPATKTEGRKLVRGEDAPAQPPAKKDAKPFGLDLSNPLVAVGGLALVSKDFRRQLARLFR